MMFIIFVIILLKLLKSQIIQPNITKDLPDKYCISGKLNFYNHTPFGYVYEEPKLCFGEIFLLNYVQSSSSNFDKRIVIRETWGSLRYVNNEPIRLLFIIGRPNNPEMEVKIQKEMESYKDIVQADFHDTYYNLTLKHIVALQYIDRYCQQARYIAKTDDDTFINIFILVSYLKFHFDPKNKFILGKIAYNEKPIRDKTSKWYVSEDMYVETNYPPFIKGSAYIISQAAIKPLSLCAYYHKFHYLDDVFITGLISQISYVKLLPFHSFYGHIWLNDDNITMNMMDNLFIVHQYHYKAKNWHILWRNLLQMEL